MDLIRDRPTGDASGPLRLPAGMVEDAVVGEIRRMIRALEIAARTIKALRDESPTVDEQAIEGARRVRSALGGAGPGAEQRPEQERHEIRLAAMVSEIPAMDAS